jgi:hypothetical protein
MMFMKKDAGGETELKIVIFVQGGLSSSGNKPDMCAILYIIFLTLGGG